MLKILHLVSLSYLIIASDIVRCNSDYAFSFEAGGWLKLHLTPQTWEEALVRCFDGGAVLASPLNKGLANALRTQMEQSGVNGHIFLGTHDLHSKGDYVSIEGVPLCDLEIELRVHGNRVNTSDCLSMTADGSSYYSSCEDPLPFICYRKQNNPSMNECGTFDNEYRLNNHIGSCYRVYYDKQSWPRAYRICASEGGHLVILNDAEEASFVTGMLPAHTEKSDPWERFHVGLRCWGKERVWTTIHDLTQCKPDYLFSFEAGGWLKLHPTPFTWEEAFVRCHDEGAVLASPLNKELAKTLQSQLAQSGVQGRIFLGTHDLYAKGHYVSVEGVPLSDMDIRWGPHTNAVENGDCLAMSVDGSAYFSSCQDPLPFICYRKLDNKTVNECGTFDSEYYLNQRTGNCYKVHLDKQTWMRAYSICASEGGYLAILNDEEEAIIIRNMFPAHMANQSEMIHVGLGAWGKERIWTTIHGERMEDVYHNWLPGKPDNFKGIQNRGSWKDKLDDLSVSGVKLMFACEKSPQSRKFEDLPPCSEKIIRTCSNVCDESQFLAK